MITVSYNYSSNDLEFIERGIKEAQKFTDDIQISYVNRFFNGEEENEELVEKTKEIAKGNEVSLNEIEFDLSLGCNRGSFKHWHNVSRFTNFNKAKYDYILFLDGDEIIDGESFKRFLSAINLTDHNSYIFNVYWYFRSKNLQATHWEEGPVMANKNKLSQGNFMSEHERWNLLADPCSRNTKSLEGKPLIHHYSWAKGENEDECKLKLLKKVSSWGHAGERDWAGIIEEEFSRPFNGRDFIHNYSFIET